MINAGEFNKRISIVRHGENIDADGFKTVSDVEICKAWAKIKTTKGFTLIKNGSNFEDATTFMLIRKPSAEISRKDIVKYDGREWKIRFLSDIDEAGKFLELQVEEVRQNG